MARSSSADPLEKFRFLMDWSEGNGSESSALVRVGFHDIQMPKRTTNKGTYREGTDPDINQLFAGLSTMEDITLSRGLIAGDLNGEFYKWASAVHNPTSGHKARSPTTLRPTNAAAANYKKDVTLKMLDRTGAIVRAWRLYNSFPTAFNPGSDLNAAEDGEKSLEQLTLAYEDFKEVSVANGVLLATSAPVSTDVGAATTV